MAADNAFFLKVWPISCTLAAPAACQSYLMHLLLPPPPLLLLLTLQPLLLLPLRSLLRPPAPHRTTGACRCRPACEPEAGGWA